MADSLFRITQLAELGIALHKVAHDERHLHNEFPIGILAGAVLLLFGAILIPTFVHLAIFFSPSHRLGIFFVVVNTFFHAAKNFCFVHTFVAHTEIFLEEVLVNDTACDTHTLATDRKIALAAHRSYSQCCTRPTQNLFCNIGRNRIVCDVLHIVSVDAKSRQPLLRMPRQNGSEIHRTRAFRTIETPNSLRPMRVHVHCFRAVAPARCNANRCAHAFALKLSLTSSSFSNATDCSVGNNAFYRCTIGMANISRNQFCHRLCQRHCFFLQTFAHATLTTVNRGANTNFRVFAHSISLI